MQSILRLVTTAAALTAAAQAFAQDEAVKRYPNRAVKVPLRPAAGSTSPRA